MNDDEFLKTAEEAARLGGDVLRDWADRITVSEKSRANLVTEADFASQEAIHKHIQSRYADHGFLGEEGLSEERILSDYRWIIDPLDGTCNYVHGFPYYAVTMALQCKQELIAGVVYDPTRDEMFSAVRGRGATLNGRALKTSSATAVADAMTVASLPVGTAAADPAVARFLNVLPHARTVQRTGSAALNLAYVACGRIDVYWSATLKPWDMAAGALLVKEAGGEVSRLDGQTFRVEGPEILACNGAKVHKEMQGLLKL